MYIHCFVIKDTFLKFLFHQCSKTVIIIAIITIAIIVIMIIIIIIVKLQKFVLSDTKNKFDWNSRRSKNY